jgi:3-oxoacyl-[acyl-carrier protein] reductase
MRRSKMRFKGQVAIVTGGSKGLGKVIAKKLVQEGASVVINGRDMKVLEETAQKIRQEGGQITAIQADVSKSKEVFNQQCRNIRRVSPYYGP